MEDVAACAEVVAFDVHRCPVADYFRREGRAPLCVPTFCDLDFPLARVWGAVLERTGTLAGGAPRCDFRWRPSPQGPEPGKIQEDSPPEPLTAPEGDVR
jgi:ubiquinone biosynthesis protein